MVDGVIWGHEVAGSSPAIQTKVELILVTIGTMVKIENFCIADRSGKRQWKGGNLVRFKKKLYKGIEPPIYPNLHMQVWCSTVSISAFQAEGEGSNPFACSNDLYGKSVLDRL